jgi:chromosome segregation ATPase
MSDPADTVNVDTLVVDIEYAWLQGEFGEARRLTADLAARARERDEAREAADAHRLQWHRLVDEHLAAEADRDSLRLALDAEKHNHRKDNAHLIGERDRFARRVAELEAESKRLRLYRERVEGLPEGTLAGDGGGA